MELDKKEKRDPEHNGSPAANPLSSGATLPESGMESLLREYGKAMREERDKPAPLSNEEFAKIMGRVRRLSAEEK